MNNKIRITMWTEEDMDMLFGFLYSNKCIANYIVDEEGNDLEDMEIEILEGLDHIEMYDGAITLVASTYDKVTFKDTEYYKVSIL